MLTSSGLRIVTLPSSFPLNTAKNVRRKNIFHQMKIMKIMKIQYRPLDWQRTFCMLLACDGIHLACDGIKSNSYKICM